MGMAHSNLSRKKKILLAGGAAAAAMVPVLWWQNNGVTVSEFTYADPKLPKGFDGCRILHVSDLHNKEFGPNQSKLLELTCRAEPDFIVMTGDLVNDGRDIHYGVSYLCQAARIAPVYYAPGNHEKKSGRYHEIAEKLIQGGVHVLFNRVETLKHGGSEAAVIGIADPRFWGFEYLDSGITDKFAVRLSQLKEQAGEKYTLLLSHRPELLEIYAQNQIDVAFSGHAHGGQFRLPRIGGVAAAGQGFFPEYTSGLYRMGTTEMVVSRGLGNSIIKLRFHNRPELVVLTLQKS